ncbi:methionine adenosyltransferase [Erysipelothrix sp. HDW6C]|uniref:methionine adenosyltransferase n=1 Tax=Erysipelothrix sp. HDW6C TaxID=2714930 RepID=UPI00140DFC69|nr:methionine adenosyltransferase [Erysipelothrix sp. HDW6C]QIK70337.1 methionine adenosyltransferase [Erysipelothrix sp. HDW6C]
MEFIYFTSESVTDGHPDKMCDQIADAILDAALSEDVHAKMAVEATIKDDFVLVYGEANTTAVLDYAAIAKNVIADIGYTENYEVLVKVNKQSAQINHAVTSEENVGAGDQGIMFGYATNETESYMPLPIELAHKLSKQLSDVKRDITWLLPDGKTQVTVAYKDGKPVFVHTVLVSASHMPGHSAEEIRETIMEHVIKPVIDPKWLTEETRYIINPSGEFSIAGPFSDSGTTGRKIVVDTYGGVGRIGGGCFSSKDPSKVDRSAAYYSRYVAKSVVAAGLADKIEIQLSYAIGLSDPLSIHIDTFGTHKRPESEILEIIKNNFNFKVGNIIKELDLLRPIYRESANFGAFGRDGFPWETIKKLTF